MASWANFYLLTGTSAAALIGLMFIALTFGARLVKPETAGPTRWVFSGIIHHFVHAFLIACVTFIPSASPGLVGGASAGIAFIRLLTIPFLFKHLQKAEQVHHNVEWSDWILNVVLPAVLYLFLIASGIAYLAGASWSYFGIALSVIGLLLLGFVAAWDMLLWMATQA